MFEQMKKQMENTAKQTLIAALERSRDFVKDAKGTLLEVVTVTKENTND